ncbi:MAG: LuxR C-terminal-related transcriptional regulator [Bacillota bacterium]
MKVEGNNVIQLSGPRPLGPEWCHRNEDTAMPIAGDQDRRFIVCFALFGAWHLSFAFQGQVLSSLAKNAGADLTGLVLISILIQFIALFSAGFLVKKQAAAKVTMIVSIIVCLAGSLIFFLPFSPLWHIAMVAVSCFAGLFVASWGFYYKAYSHAGIRLRTVADVLICVNILMILINVITVSISAPLGLGVAVVFLSAALPVAFRLEANPGGVAKHRSSLPKSTSAILQPLVVLCLFILVFTINSGLMYQVVTPAFAHLKLLTTYYWAFPYIAALLILRRLPSRVNMAYILYLALIMLGLSFILFMWIDRSAGSYLLINGLMLGAFGVADLFWWSILGNMLDYSDNPAQVFGVGLSMNVLGILIGGTIGSSIMAGANDPFTTSVVALMVVFASLMMLPLLNAHLTRLLKSHQFLVHFSGLPEAKTDEAPDLLGENRVFTDKEKEVVRLMLRGYTYKAMSQELFISENTVKYHVKNIYQKLNINSKMELVNMFSEARSARNS